MTSPPRHRIVRAAALLTVLLGVAPASAGASQVRFYGSDGRQVDAVDAQNVGQAVSSFQRARKTTRNDPPSAPTQACAAEPTTKAFAALGDNADYALAPGGDFERGPSGWTLSDGAIVPGNETVGILGGLRSLLIGGRATGATAAYSPALCVDPSKPTFRFLMRANRLDTTVITTLRFHPKDNPTLTVEIDSAANPAGLGWSAAAPNELATKIAGQLMNDTGDVQIGFRSVDGSGARATAQIDNLLIDPYRRG